MTFDSSGGLSFYDFCLPRLSLVHADFCYITFVYMTIESSPRLSLYNFRLPRLSLVEVAVRSITFVYMTFDSLYDFSLQLMVVFKKWNVTYDCMQKTECVAKKSHQTPSVEILDPHSGNFGPASGNKA